MTEVLNRQLSELVPLNGIQERQEAMARCIGPLSTAYTIELFEDVFPYGIVQAGALHTGREAMYIARSQPSKIQNELEEVNHKLFARINDSAKEQPFVLAPDQEQLFDNFSFYRTDLRQSLDDSLNAHTRIINNLALPAYIFAREELTEIYPKPLGNITRFDAASVLRRDDFLGILRSLSFSANGTYASITLGDDCDVFRDIQASIEKVEGLSENCQPVPMYEICRKNPDGNIALSSKAVKILRLFMKLDNSHGIHNNKKFRMNGSRGCPVSLKSTRCLEDDFTTEQWQKLIEGDHPIASFDGTTLTMLRSPINEYTNLLASGLDNPH